MLVLVPLGGHQVHKWSNFVREAWLIKEKWNKRSCLKPPMNADARRCSAPLIGVHRRFPTLGGMRSARYNLLELGDSLCLRVFVVDWVQVLPRRHVAGPLVFENCLHQLFRQPLDGAFVPLSVSLRKVIAKQRNVFFSVSQGRDRKTYDIQPEVKILPEFTFFHRFFDSYVGRSEDPGIDVLGTF